MRKKLCLVMVMVLSLLFTAPVFAAQQRAAMIRTTLSFNGNVAVTRVVIYGDYATDKIDADIELWRGSVLVDSWSASGTEYIDCSRNVNVVKGKTYTLKVFATINGKEYPEASVTKTCN